jgi:hypothetical protein
VDLKRRGLDERMNVMFTSDNGPHNKAGPGYDPRFFDVCGRSRDSNARSPRAACAFHSSGAGRAA